MKPCRKSRSSLEGGTGLLRQFAVNHYFERVGFMNKKLLFALLFAVGCGQAMADWVKVASNEQSVFYLDSAVSKKVGANVMIWILRDHTSPRFGGAGAHLSSKDQIEVDCSARRIRKVYSADYPQPMGAGKFVYSEHGPMSWNDVAPNTIIKRVVDRACMWAVD